MSEPEEHAIWSLRPDLPATPVSASPWAPSAQPVSPPPMGPMETPQVGPVSEPTAPQHVIPPAVLAAPPPAPAAVSGPPSPPIWSSPTSGAPDLSPLSPPRRRAGLIVLAGIVVLAVVAGAVIAVAVFSSDKQHAAAPKQAAATVSAGEQARGGVGQPVNPGQASAAASNAATSPSAAASTQPAANAALVDNFTGTTLDAKRWDAYASTSAKWVKSNIQVHNGELQIIGVGKDPTGKTNTSGGLCWCGDGGNRLYGTWEVRARYDAGSGYGQIIGLWPRSDNQADGSLSFADTSDPARQNMHGRVVAAAAPGTVATTVDGDFTAWHTFKVDWRATYIKMYVDGKVFFDSTTSSTKVTIPKTPMHLIMQQPVGPGEGVPAANASTPAKVMMHIDWVKMSP